MKQVHLIPLAVVLLTTSAFAAQANDTDDKFVKKASVANAFEIQSSKIALDRSHNDDVRQFAQVMIDDHTDAGKAMKNALQDSKVDSSLATDTLDPRHQKLIDKLSNASDEDFDDKYVSEQTDAHKEAVSLFKDYSKTGHDKALKGFAKDTLPTLKKHMEHVKQLNAS